MNIYIHVWDIIEGNEIERGKGEQDQHSLKDRRLIKRIFFFYSITLPQLVGVSSQIDDEFIW